MAVLGALGTLFQQGLRKLIFLAHDPPVGTMSKIFNMNTTKRAYEEWTGMVGPGVAELKPKGEAMTYKNVLVETAKRVLIQTRALGIRLNFEDIQDDQTGALKQMAKAVGRAHRVAQEVLMANVFNAAFGTWYRTGYDGLALCSTSHTLNGDSAYVPTTTNFTALPVRSGTTWSNRLATDSDLDYTTLQDMKVLMRRTIGREGDFYPITPKVLLVPPELEPIAQEITMGRERPDTANRAMSTLYGSGLEIVCADYLLDQDACFLLGDKSEHDLQYFLRMGLTVRNSDDRGTWDQLTESMMRDGVGFHDPRGVVGTPGA